MMTKLVFLSYCLLVPLFFLIPFSSKGQTFIQFELKGRVLDAKTNETVIGANIYDAINNVGTTSDQEGFFSFELKTIPTELEISYIGYEKFKLTVSEKMDEAITIFLNPTANDLPEAVVSANRKTEEVLADKERVMDFVFFGKNILVMLLDLETRKERLELRSTDGEIIDTFSLGELTGQKKFHKTCLGSINIINGDKVHQLVIEEDIILGIGPFTYFHSYDWEVKKCVLANAENVYFQFYGYFGQLIDYHLFEKDRDTNYVFTTIYNEKQIRLLFEDMAPLISIDNSTMDMTANHPDVLREIRNAQENLDGWKHFFYQPIYCPLFQSNEGVVVFNHLDGKLDFCQNSGQLLHTVPIKYQLENNWDKQVLQDETNGKFYTLFSNKAGKQLSEINLKDGSLGEPIYFLTKGIEQMGILDGQLFFLEKDSDPVFGYSVKKLKRLEIENDYNQK